MVEKLEKQTKEKFTSLLIDKLKKDLGKKRDEFYNILDVERITELVNHEIRGNKIKELSSQNYKNIAYKVKITKRSGKKRIMVLNGNFKLSQVSSMIQQEFDLEPMHLYEFEIGKYKYGPECDEWQEIFDSLDNAKLGGAISMANLKPGDKFRFLYDFGDRIEFKIEVVDVLSNMVGDFKDD